MGFWPGLDQPDLLAAGARLISPLTWQSDRGLQIEVDLGDATLMLARAARPDHWIVDISQYQAYEIFGPGANVWVVIRQRRDRYLGLAVIILLTIRAFRRIPDRLPPRSASSVLATVAIMTITNKTLSPQYLLWVGGPMAALMAYRAAGHTGRAACDQPDRRTGADPGSADPAGLIHCSMTATLVASGQAMIILSTVVTAIRNLALVWSSRSRSAGWPGAMLGAAVTENRR